jgi:sugar phosphate isomerase/epimerase
MEVALTIAEETDLLLGIEPETANVVDSAARADLLLRELRSPRLRIVLDPANLFQAEDLPRQHDILDEAFDTLGAHVIMAHAKDMSVDDGEIRHVAAGTGLLDYRHYLSLLENVPTHLVVHGLSESEVPASLAYLRATNARLGRVPHREVKPCRASA